MTIGDIQARTGPVARSGLPALWSARYPVLRDPSRLAAAVEHVTGTLRALPAPYRIVFRVAFLLTAGLSRLPAEATTRPWWLRLPLLAEVWRVSTTLALYGALDADHDTGADR